MTRFGKRMVLGLILVIALASVASVYAIWRNSMQLAPSPTISSVTSYPLELRTELVKTEFEQGELIEVRAYLKNISNRTVQLYAQSLSIWDFEIVDANGSTVYRWSDNYYFVLDLDFTLMPGMELNHTQKSLVYDRRNTYSMVPLQLSKGTYTIIEFAQSQTAIAYLEPYEKLGKLAELNLETPPITITIL